MSYSSPPLASNAVAYTGTGATQIVELGLNPSYLYFVPSLPSTFVVSSGYIFCQDGGVTHIAPVAGILDGSRLDVQALSTAMAPLNFNFGGTAYVVVAIGT